MLASGKNMSICKMNKEVLILIKQEKHTGLI